MWVTAHSESSATQLNETWTSLPGGPSIRHWHWSPTSITWPVANSMLTSPKGSVSTSGELGHTFSAVDKAAKADNAASAHAAHQSETWDQHASSVA